MSRLDPPDDRPCPRCVPEVSGTTDAGPLCYQHSREAEDDAVDHALHQHIEGGFR